MPTKPQRIQIPDEFRDRAASVHPCRVRVDLEARSGGGGGVTGKPNLYRWRGTVSQIVPDGTTDGHSTCDGCRFMGTTDGALTPCPGLDLGAEEGILPCAFNRVILVEVPE